MTNMFLFVEKFGLATFGDKVLKFSRIFFKKIKSYGAKNYGNYGNKLKYLVLDNPRAPS